MPNLVGIGLSQVPTNGMLGGLAYQDPEHASIKDLDLKNLSQINSETSDTATDIFVYDTRKDSDGGAWRKRTQHTSWYNETLGTATRGTRKEFPAVAVIVAEIEKLTIYDGDDPDLPMWMVFLSPSTTPYSLIPNVSGDITSITALNGKITLGYHHNYGIGVWDFISEFCINTWRENSRMQYRGTIAERNDQKGSLQLGEPYILDYRGNDIAMTVLPNAPIDDATGLPVPTIAVGTGGAGSANGGVSVIKDDGSVVDINNSGGAGGYASYNVEFGSNNELIHTQAYNNSYASVNIFDDIPSSDISGSNSYSGARSYLYNNGVPDLRGGANGGSTPNLEYVSKSSNGDIAFGFQNTDAKLSLLSEPEGAGTTNQYSAVAYIASDYNTGWMIGDTQGAFLSDTDTTNVTGSELITNTDFSSDLSGWSNGNPSQFTRVTTNVGGDTDGKLMYYAVDNNVRTFYQYITCVAGEKYVLSLRACSDTASAMVIDIDGTNVITIDDNNNAAFITKQHTFTAGSTSVRIRIESAAANRSYFTDFSVRLAEEDRSRNKKGLQVFGTITKQPVATGAELVSYSGWSSSNYLRQPYNSDLDFGTGNWSYMFWYNPNDAESGDVIFSRWSYNVDSVSAPRVSVYFNSGNLRVDTSDASAGTAYQGHFGSDGTQDSNEWHCAVILRRGPNLEIWIDGVNYRTGSLNSNSDGSYTKTNAIIEIGHSPGNGAPEAGLELALFRISGTAPSPEQIKKMYNDEKHLFQENAKATLYGSSDAVTGLAHDDSTDSLHVGTSAGRSEFQGLCRINNTTEAVTTAISASNGLVAEQ